MPHMQSAAWTSSDEPGVGTTGKGIMKMAGREMELMLEITRWDVPGRLGFKILNVPFPLEATEYVYRLEPEDGSEVERGSHGDAWTFFEGPDGYLYQLFQRSGKPESKDTA
jgi:hypothetical protein